MRRPALIECTALAMLVLSIGCVASADESDQHGRYPSTDEFLSGTFGSEHPEAQTIWITRELREPIERLLGHPFASLRVRYWLKGNKSAWILNEIGKDLPITIGVVVQDETIETVRILEFRESRGWEVRYPFFTDQFHDASLDDDGQLDKDIDGITGATLSVGAVTRVAKVALYVHEQVTKQN